MVFIGRAAPSPGGPTSGLDFLPAPNACTHGIFSTGLSNKAIGLTYNWAMSPAIDSQALSTTAPLLTGTAISLTAVAVFALAYLFVIAEEFTRVRKSTPVIVAAGIIWVLVAVAWLPHGGAEPTVLLRHSLVEYAELLLFLLVAMSYVHTLEERQVFAALRARLVARGFSLRTLFWITGLLAFVLSPVLDNLTTALVLGAVAVAVGQGNQRFIVLACINIVVAANAGGAFSPFGDITTLMVWQKGHLTFVDFLALFLPSLVNWIVPAICMTFAVPKARPDPLSEDARIRTGGLIVIVLFAATIALTVSLHHFLHLPPVLGMMTGLGALQICGYVIRNREQKLQTATSANPGLRPFDIFLVMRRVEWDTLMFFYGVILCVGGLAAFGYLSTLSTVTYEAVGPTTANTLVGVASAIVDNIPVMFAVLSMSPEMSHGQWLLVTLTAGVGGSLLSVGSAAGVALMGQAHGTYTFFAHLKWTWAIALGYAASIGVHMLVNARLF
jgi:Na+/H+ antiporter NhaD/arsenite permease-like protein